MYEGKGPKDPGFAAPLDATCCRGNCRHGLLEWWLFQYSFLSLHFVAAEESENTKSELLGSDPKRSVELTGCPVCFLRPASRGLPLAEGA